MPGVSKFESRIDSCFPSLPKTKQGSDCHQSTALRVYLCWGFWVCFFFKNNGSKRNIAVGVHGNQFCGVSVNKQSTASDNEVCNEGLLARC